MEMKQGGGINSPSDMQVSLISCETNTEFTQRSHISAVVFLASQDQHSQQFFFPHMPQRQRPSLINVGLKLMQTETGHRTVLKASSGTIDRK